MKEHTKKYIHNNPKNFWRWSKTKKGISDYQFHIGTNKEAAEYEIAAEFIINFIKRTFDRGNDIVETLRTLTIQDTSVWMSKLKMSKSDDKDTKIIENRQHELQYKALLDEAIKRTDKAKIYTRHMSFYGENAAAQCKIRLPNDTTSKEKFSIIQ